MQWSFQRLSFQSSHLKQECCPWHFSSWFPALPGEHLTFYIALLWHSYPGEVPMLFFLEMAFCTSSALCNPAPPGRTDQRRSSRLLTAIWALPDITASFLCQINNSIPFLVYLSKINLHEVHFHLYPYSSLWNEGLWTLKHTSGISTIVVVRGLESLSLSLKEY